MALIGLIVVILTFVSLLAFSVFHISKTMEKKPEPLVRAVDKMTAHINDVAYWSVLYSVAAIPLTLLFIRNPGDKLISMLASVLVIMLALPFSFDRLLAQFGEKLNNPAVVEEIRNFVAWINRYEKVVSYVGAVFCVLLLTVRS